MKRPRGRMTEAEKEAANVFFRETVKAKGAKCVVCGKTERTLRAEGSRLQSHHVLPKGSMKRYGHADKIWSPENGMAVCSRDHERHSQAVARIPRRLIPEAAWAFAEGLGMAHILERHYPV